MRDLVDTANPYETIEAERRDGILQLRFHTDGGPLQWVRRRTETGSTRSPRSPATTRHALSSSPAPATFSLGRTCHPTPRLANAPHEWEPTRRQGMRMLEDFLAIEAPIIAAINGPVYRHLEVPLLADIVLAAEDASIRDSAHFASHVIPGDGVHVVLPLLMGINRARYFLLTGQTLTAQEAQELGLVSELHPREQLLERAWNLAEELAGRSDLVLRYTRLLVTHALKRDMHELLGYGLALEGLGMAERWAAPDGQA